MRERDHRRVHAPLSSRMERSCARGVEDACMIMHECGRRTRQLCSNASLTSRGVGRRFSQCSCVPSFLHAPTSVSPRGRMASHIPFFLPLRTFSMAARAHAARRDASSKGASPKMRAEGSNTKSAHDVLVPRAALRAWWRWRGGRADKENAFGLRLGERRGVQRRARLIRVEGVSPTGVKTLLDFRHSKGVIYPATSVTLARSIFGIRCAQQRSAVPSCSARGGNLEHEG